MSDVQSKDEFIEALHGTIRAMRDGNQALRDSKETIMAQRDALLSALHKIGYEPFGAAEASSAEVLEAITIFARDTIAAAESKEVSA